MPDAAPSVRGASLSERETTIAEYEDHLRTTTNRDDRPYEEGTINAYVSPAKHLDGWMTGKGIDGDFTVVDIATLNRYFREYYREHRQGGTYTQPGRLWNTGLRMMLIRRPVEAGYEGVTPHQFRHTFSDAWLSSGGSEGNLMRLNDWRTRAMVDRYADDVADRRALDAKRRKGDMF